VSASLPRDPAFDPKHTGLDKTSPQAIRLSLHDWVVARQALMEPIISPYESHLCEEISGIQRLFTPYQRDNVEALAHMFGLAAHACSDLEAAWHALRACFLRIAHGALRSAVEATLTAATFADPDEGPSHIAGYIDDRVRVSGVARRFEVTAPKLNIPQAEVDFLKNYLTDWLHPLTHPAAKAMRVTIIPLPAGAAVGNYFDDNHRRSYEATAANIGNVAQRLRVIFESAVPTAYLYFRP